MTKEEFKKIILPIALLDEDNRVFLTKALEGNFDNYMKAKLKNHGDIGSVINTVPSPLKWLKEGKFNIPEGASYYPPKVSMRQCASWITEYVKNYCR